MKKIIFTLLLLTNSFSILFSQNSTKTYNQIEINADFIKDTLSIDKYLKKALDSTASKIDSSQYYFKKANQLANKSQSVEQIAKVFFKHGNYYQQNYNIFEAIKEYQKALPLFEKTNDTINLSSIYFKLGQCYRYTYSTEIAFKFYSKALDLYKKKKNAVDEAYCYNEIGNLYYNKNYDISLKYYKKALPIFMKHGDYSGLALTFINLANAVSDNGNTKQGIIFYNKSLNALKKENDTYNLAIIYNNLGDSYKVIKQYDKALVFLNKALATTKLLKCNDLNPTIYNNIADVKLRQGLFDQAILFANKSIEQSKVLIDVELQNMNILILSNAYEKLNKLELALKYKNKYIKIKDLENKKNDLKNLQLYQNISELEKSQFEINKLTGQNKYKNLKLQSRRNLTYFLIFVLLILTLFIIILFIQQKAKHKVYNLLVTKTKQISKMKDKIQVQNDYLNNLNETKNKLLKIIAHDLKNPLSSIEGFTDLMIQSDENEYNQEEKLTFLNAIKDSATKASQILNDLLQWAIEHEKPIIKENICVYEMINDELKLLEIQALQKKIKIENTVDKNSNIVTNSGKLSTIIRNLVSNAIKFTPENGLISIFSETDDAFMKITIKDNGIGISEMDLEKLFRVKSKKSKLGTNSEKGSGLGIELCKEFIEKLGGEFSAKSVLNEGSSFSFTIPIH
jgi:two-component system, sensor histidine kinase and response regulator